MLRYHGYLRKSAYKEEGDGEEGEPTVLLDSAAARLVKILTIYIRSYCKCVMAAKLSKMHG